MTELINGFTGHAQRKAEQDARAREANVRGNVGASGLQTAGAWGAQAGTQAGAPGGRAPGGGAPGGRAPGGGAHGIGRASGVALTSNSSGHERAIPSYGPASSVNAVNAMNAVSRTGLSPEFLDRIPGNDRRWAWAQIDLSAISHNIRCARRAAGSNVRIMAMLNNDAFGHGIVQVGKTAISAGVEYVGVATIDEAIVLREAGVTAPVLLLSQPPAEAIPLLVAHHIMPSIYTAEFAIAYGEVADQYGATAPYHLAIDTGMNRIGIHPSDALEFLQHTSFHRALELDGTFTQLATTTDSEIYEVDRQFRRFVSAVSTLHNAGFDTGIVHCADTAATLRFPDSRLHMVRWGRGLYGMHPCSATQRLADLQPAMSVRARIVDLRQTPMSEGVSFGAHYRSAGNALICTLPIGYANGLPFALSGRIDVLYDGMRCGQVGDICMDQCMFEVDMRTSTSRALHQPARGDEVVLVGTQGDLAITLEDLAYQSKNTPAGLACAFGARLPRVYV